MRVTIFGANGATGRLLTEYALKEGHVVTALIRNPDAFKFWETVRVVQGSVFELPTVKETLEEAEAVFSALGAHSPLRNENVLPRAVPVIVQAMQEMGVRRIIALGSAGALPDSLDKQPAWRRWFVENVVYTLFLKWPVQEQRVQYQLLSRSGLDWTMVMPPMLTNGTAKGRIRVDGDALPAGSSHISRADVAQFMLRELGKGEWIQRGVYIGY
ncbi:NAD(P)-dependent oxidoreductase [Edaphobacter albus]|uniref:NAD(P)-dependent oxidoreductase n=1 Tax=Edaphobacter sp. 4G125 TaxID=2763071 RepID=UPI0016482A61|nr:SDR family oxidoreductase [Edaphobacter sp. 4G125]QNI37035.1 SDR family oxidoreductase [Edaphobacter sp. 4G125]